MRGRRRGRPFLLALAVPAVWAASLGAPVAASAQGSAYSIYPGDWISAGYAFQMSTHAVNNAQFYFQNAVASFAFGCTSGSTTWTIQVGMAQGPYTVAATNNNWVASGQQSSYLTYQGAAQIPATDRCPSGQQLQANVNTLRFSANVASPNDTKDQIQIEFHAWDAYAANPSTGNIDCANPQQNPGSGLSACSGPWAYSPPKTTAAQYATAPPPTPAPTPQPPPPPTPKPSTSQPPQPPPTQAPVVKPGSSSASASGSSTGGRSAGGRSSPPSGGRGGGAPTVYTPGPVATPSPTPAGAAVVIGSGGVVGPAPLLTTIATNWVLEAVVGALLVVVVASLLLTSRRQRRTEAPPISPVDGQF